MTQPLTQPPRTVDVRTLSVCPPKYPLNTYAVARIYPRESALYPEGGLATYDPTTPSSWISSPPHDPQHLRPNFSNHIRPSRVYGPNAGAPHHLLGIEACDRPSLGQELRRMMSKSPRAAAPTPDEQVATIIQYFPGEFLKGQVLNLPPLESPEAGTLLLASALFSLIRTECLEGRSAETLRERQRSGGKKILFADAILKACSVFYGIWILHNNVGLNSTIYRSCWNPEIAFGYPVKNHEGILPILAGGILLGPVLLPLVHRMSNDRLMSTNDIQSHNNDLTTRNRREGIPDELQIGIGKIRGDRSLIRIVDQVFNIMAIAVSLALMRKEIVPRSIGSVAIAVSVVNFGRQFFKPQEVSVCFRALGPQNITAPEYPPDESHCYPRYNQETHDWDRVEAKIMFTTMDLTLTAKKAIKVFGQQCCICLTPDSADLYYVCSNPGHASCLSCLLMNGAGASGNRYRLMNITALRYYFRIDANLGGFTTTHFPVMCMSLGQRETTIPCVITGCDSTGKTSIDGGDAFVRLRRRDSLDEDRENGSRADYYWEDTIYKLPISHIQQDPRLDSPPSTRP